MNLLSITGRRRLVATFSTRRGLLAGLAAGLLAARSLASGNDDAEAKKKRHRKKKRKSKRKKNGAETRVDANCPGPTDDGGLSAISGDLRLAQTFTARASGQLVRAEIQILDSPSAFGDFILQVGTVDAFGVPSNDVLAATSVANAAVPVGESSVEFTFGKPASVVAGTQYALILTRPGSNTLIWRGHFGDSCAGRAFFSSDQTAPFEGASLDLDLIFTTFVQS